MSTRRKLILFPQALPEYFAATPRQDWRIKRGWLADVRIYTIEQWEKGKIVNRVLFPAKFLMKLILKMEQLMGKTITLHREYSGQIVQICGEYMIPDDDVRTYEEYLKDMGVKAA